jgi:hypothetical protein
MYKENFKFENYLRILEDKDIYTLCKLRTTNNKFPMEIGGNNIDGANRICTENVDIPVFTSNSYIITFCAYSIGTVNIIPANFHRKFVVGSS